MPIHSNSAIDTLPGVGPAGLLLFAKLNIKTVGDLLHHAPSSYVDYTTIQTVHDAAVGVPVALRGSLHVGPVRRGYHNRKITVSKAIFSDATGKISVVWFHRYIPTLLSCDDAYLTGTIRLVGGSRQLVNPVVEPVDGKVVAANRLLACYPLTTGLTQWKVRRTVAAALQTLPTLSELPDRVRLANRLVSHAQALQLLHTPTALADVALARRRLAFDELLVVRLGQEILHRRRIASAGYAIKISDKEAAVIYARFPFVLNAEQQEALVAVRADLTRATPSRRLVQGEVGSGKTAIAAAALAMAARRRLQGLYLAPTDVLARQQYETLHTWFAPLGMRVALLTARSSAVGGEKKTNSEVRRLVETGDVSMVVGTQAALTAATKFHSLAVAVIDEQHRFGVAARHEAYRKGGSVFPHLLSLTATPIPRTLRRAFLKDFSVSTLHFSPHGKREVHTAIVRAGDRLEAEQRLRARMRKGEQAFVVCPLIDPSDALGVRSVSEARTLFQKVLSGLPIGFVHGRLSADEKTLALEDFRQGKSRLLVATSLIEVGIDVPAATIMIIENAERFGLAQLHQLRGRVGRAGNEGFCLLFVSDVNERALRRLRLFAKTADAFSLSDLDLLLRGPGDWFGYAQSGFPELNFADLADESCMAETETAAKLLVDEDPTGTTYPEYYQAAERLVAEADAGL